MNNLNQLTKANQQSSCFYEENLRQTRETFDFRLNILKVSAIVSFFSVLLIYSGKVETEKVEAAQGVINGIVSLTFKFTRDGSDRFDSDKNY